MQYSTDFCTFEFTDLAVKMATQHSGEGGVERVMTMVIAELMETFPNPEVSDLFVMIVKLDDEMPFVAWPTGLDTLQVDLAELRESEPLKSGPHAGKRVRYPLPASGMASPLAGLGRLTISKFESGSDSSTVLIDAREVEPEGQDDDGTSPGDLTSI